MEKSTLGTSGGVRLPVTEQLARLTANFAFSELPTEVVFLAKQCFLDWLGVTLAGSRQPLATILQDEIAEQGGNPQASILGTRNRASAQQAALVNGAASHALDYDDVVTSMTGHPSVPVFPALFALAESRGGNGRDFITAFAAGFEVECRMGLLVNPEHYSRGFHSTGTLGTFGAAAACARLLSLDQGQIQHALGIAAAQASGLKSMFGTMCKPFHAGKAAANGLLAATLAGRGFISNPEAIESDQGFAATQTTSYQPDQALAGFASGFALREVLFKYHAACYGTHSSIESILKMREQDGLRAEDVESIQLRVPISALSMCNIAEPQTALEGKFSLRFTTALALGYDETGEAAFTDARVHDPSLTALRDLVTVTADESLVEFANEVTVKLKDGRELHEAVDVNTPASDLHRQWQRLSSKFRGLAGPVVGMEATEALLAAVSRLDELADMRTLARLCVPARVAALA